MNGTNIFGQAPDPLDGNSRPGQIFSLTRSNYVLQIVNLLTNAVVSGTTFDGVVGQKLDLGVVAHPTNPPAPPPESPGGAPGSLTNIQWTIPGTTIKTYTRSTGAGTATPLAAADLTNSEVVFYFIDGSSKTVTVQANIDGSPQSASVTINVQRPSVDHFTVGTSSVTISTQYPGLPGQGAMAAWQPDGNLPGCQWDTKVTVPAAFGGQVAFTQLINVNRSWTSKQGQTRSITSSGSFILDDGAGIEYGGANTVAAGASIALNGSSRGPNGVPFNSDSPGMGLYDADSTASATDSFQTFLMYQPAGSDSIWVTLQTATWGWNGSAKRNDTRFFPPPNWSLASGSMTPQGMGNGSDSSNLPQWTNCMTNVYKNFVGAHT